MNGLVKGSLTEVTRKSGVPMAQSFLNVKAFVMVDVSASMRDHVTMRVTRWDLAKEQLENLQNENPGEIAVACFSSRAAFCPSGVLQDASGSTDMKEALNFLKQADNCGIRLVIISDGEPDDSVGALCLAQTFKSKIDTIFVGDETGSGRKFLRDLAMATGGISIINQEKSLNLLSENITRLIAA